MVAGPPKVTPMFVLLVSFVVQRVLAVSVFVIPVRMIRYPRRLLCLWVRHANRCMDWGRGKPAMQW